MTVTRRFNNGAVTAMIVYTAEGILEWTIVVFPDIDAAKKFAADTDMEYHVVPEVTIQLNALNEAAGSQN